MRDEGLLKWEIFVMTKINSIVNPISDSTTDKNSNKLHFPFLVFEGLDGAGKSTLINAVKNYLISNSHSVVTTREPGGTELGEQLRKLILQKDGDHPTPRCELLLYEAIRAHHVDKLIKPAIENKNWVLCDRFTGSSIAFQGGGRSISKEEVIWLNKFATSNLKPDLTILIDISEEESRKRRQNRESSSGEKQDRIESENSDFHQKVRDSFLEQSKQENWLVLSAQDTVEKLLDNVISKLKEKKWLV